MIKGTWRQDRVKDLDEASTLGYWAARRHHGDPCERGQEGQGQKGPDDASRGQSDVPRSQETRAFPNS